LLSIVFLAAIYILISAVGDSYLNIIMIFNGIAFISKQPFYIWQNLPIERSGAQ
jgi:hypothetical protein